MMKNIERFWAVMNYEDFDYPPFFEEPVWKPTLERWHSEGLSETQTWQEVLEIKELRFHHHGFNHGPYPEFPVETIEENDEFKIFRDKMGRLVKDFKSHTSMPEWLEFPVTDRGSFAEILPRFQGHFEERLTAKYEDLLAKVQEPDFDALVTPPAGNYFFTLDGIAGVETVSLMFYDCPDLLHQYFDGICDLCCQFLEKYLPQVKGKVRTIGSGEDLAYKNGPFFSPAVFEEFFVPRYQRIIDIAKNNDIELFFLDSDGNYEVLLPKMLEIGINIHCPREVAAGMEPLHLREKFGKDLRMVGGVDKRILVEGKDAINSELNRLYPLLCEGGFIPKLTTQSPRISPGTTSATTSIKCANFATPARKQGRDWSVRGGEINENSRKRKNKKQDGIAMNCSHSRHSADLLDCVSGFISLAERVGQRNGVAYLG